MDVSDESPEVRPVVVEGGRVKVESAAGKVWH